MNPLARQSRQLGFTLIEIMVGCVIGVVGLLVIFQTLSVWNRHTQTTMTGGEADVAGSLAIFNIERDLRLGGYGFGTADPATMGCAVSGTDTSSSRAFTFALSPIEIVVGAGGAPDQINVLYGNSAFFATGEHVISSTATTKFLTRRNGFKQGDMAVMAGNASASAASATCTLIQVTDTSNADGFTIGHTTTAFSSYYAASGAAAASAPFNAASGTGTTYDAGTLFNLGPQPRRNTWAIANGRVLQRADLIFGTAPFDIAEGVINLKAEYGYDTDGNLRIADTEWASTPPLDWTKVLAIRVAVLVRSSQFEQSADTSASAAGGAVTASAPTWGNGDADHTFLMADVDGSSDSHDATQAVADNWRYYRYRVYEKVIPLRNMIWGGAP